MEAINISDGIKKFRDRMRFKTQTDLAKALNLDQTNISNWEGGKSFPSFQVTGQLFDMGITVEELFGIEYNEMHNLVPSEPLKQAFVSREEFENLKVELGIKKAAGVG
jgi:predicted transcriptional regulator